jgi:peptide/nickel transport system substrate-binding protein
VAPYRNEIEVAADLSGSIYGTGLWPYTLRRTGEVGGSVTWAMPSILTQPWNPIAGSNWIYDQTLIRGTGEWSYVSDPNTGLAYPHRLESVTVTAQEGLPIGKTLDWVTLEFASEIVVPDDAWVDWDATNQVFITAAEKYTETTTAAMKLTTTYPADLFETVKWHDGSPFSLADMVMFWILNFDQAKPESPYHDEAQIPALDSFLSSFKGLRIVSTDPVVIEFYTDDWGLEADAAATTITNLRTLWPYYGFGQGAWHQLAIGLMAEGKGLAAFSSSKATANEVEQLNYISGPTVQILTDQLITPTIPYSPTLSQYITPEEAATRFANLQAFGTTRGHYWIGTGPLFLQRAFPVEGTAILQRNLDFPDPSDKWSQFSAPPIATVEVDGAGQVTIGEEASFDVFVDLGDEPYPAADIQEVTYLVFDATGAQAASGVAEAAGDGLYTITLGSDVTGALVEGSNRLEVVVVSKLVALPSLATFEFVTVP